MTTADDGNTFYVAANLEDHSMVNGEAMASAFIKIENEAGQVAVNRFIVDCTTGDFAVQQNAHDLNPTVHPKGKADEVSSILTAVICGTST